MSQIFKNDPPLELLNGFLNTFAQYEKNKFTVSKAVFKKAKMKDDYINNFINTIKQYYYPSKNFYVKRKINYKNFITIIRQICKYYCIPYTSKISYFKSNYEIKYFIYVTTDLSNNITLTKKIEENTNNIIKNKI